MRSAKLFEVGTFDLGFCSFNLIAEDAARTIATSASSKTGIAPPAGFCRDVVCRTEASSVLS